MAGTPELVIPIRLDPAKAASALRQLGTAGRQAGDSVAEGAGKADKAVANVGSSALGAVKAMSGMAVAGSVFSAITARAKETSDYVQKVAADFIALQKTMQSIMAITNQPNTNQATAEEARKGAAANRTPAQWTAFRTAFMAKASNYVGEKPSAVLNTKEAEELQADMAEFAAAKGATDQEMADLVGGILAQEKGPTTAKKIKERIGKAWAQLEASSKDPSKLAAGLTEQMAMGMTLEEAAPKLAAMPEIAPGQESAYLKSTLAHLEMARGEGKLEAYGVTAEMSPAEMLEKTVEGISKEAGQGPDRQKRIGELIRERVTKYQESVQTLKGFVNKGPEAMKMWKDIGEQTPADAVDKAIARDRASDAGKVRAAEAKEGLADVEAGARWADVELEKKKARTKLKNQGRFEKSQWGDVGRGLVGGGIGVAGFGIPGTGVSTQEQIVNEETISELRTRAAALGVAGDSYGQFSRDRSGRAAAGDVAYRTQETVNAEIKELLKLIAEHTKPKAPALSAPPPHFWDARM